MSEVIASLLAYLSGNSISNIGIIILVLLSLIQIAPIKINPYDMFFSWLRQKMNGDLKEEIAASREQTNKLMVDFFRQHILRFARECRQNILHTQDEWQYVINMTSEYETYCEENHVMNGIISAETAYIKKAHEECIIERKFA